MQTIDAAAFLAETEPATDVAHWSDVLNVLAEHAVAEHAGARIRLAGREASSMIEADGCAAWMVARLGEPAVIVLRRGLSAGEPSWHTARMLIGLHGSPLVLEPGMVGVIGSRDRPSGGWDNEADERLDRLAVEMLRGMGVPGWLMRRLKRRVMR